jgi:hypothetical protein
VIQAISDTMQEDPLHESEDESEDKPAITWHTSLRELDEDDRQELGEDVYSLIFVAPLWGQTFYFALYVIFLKLMLFT